MPDAEPLRQTVIEQRASLRRVFDPLTGDEASDQDRRIVHALLRDFCFIDKPMEPTLGADGALVLAGQEGRRQVYLWIMQAVRKSYEDARADRDDPPEIEVKHE